MNWRAMLSLWRLLNRFMDGVDDGGIFVVDIDALKDSKSLRDSLVVNKWVGEDGIEVWREDEDSSDDRSKEEDAGEAEK